MQSESFNITMLASSSWPSLLFFEKNISGAHPKLSHQLSYKTFPSLSEFQSYRVDLIFLVNSAIVPYSSRISVSAVSMISLEQRKGWREEGATHPSNPTTKNNPKVSRELSEYKMGWFNIFTIMWKAIELWTLPHQTPTLPTLTSKLFLTRK